MESTNEPYKLIDLSNLSEKPLGFHFQLRHVLNMKKHRENILQKESTKRKYTTQFLNRINSIFAPLKRILKVL